MAHPSRLVGKPPLLMSSQLLEERSGQGMITHVAQGRVVDDVVGMTGAQQVEEVQPALAARRAEPGEIVIANLRADAVGAAVACTGVVHAHPACGLQSSPQHIAGFRQESILPINQQAHAPPSPVNGSIPRIRSAASATLQNGGPGNR